MSLRDKTIILLLMLFSFIGAAQKSITLTKLDQNTLPKQISYTGKIKTAVRWPDALGDNLVIITETGESYSKHAPADSIYRDAALYAYHFILIGTKVKPGWKVYDFIKSCPVDIAANFVNDTFSVTDLDADGTGEVWLMYRTACHGDVSPLNMKIIMYEGDKKYAMRGHNKVEYGPNQFDGGEFTFDPAFNSGPAAFKQFAKTFGISTSRIEIIN